MTKEALKKKLEYIDSLRSQAVYAGFITSAVYEAEALEALETLFPVFLKNAGYREKNIIENMKDYDIRKDGSRQEYTIISFTDTAGYTCEYCIEKEAFTN